MEARKIVALCLLGSLLLAVGGCAGGVFVQYPAFPDRSCGTCVSELR